MLAACDEPDFFCFQIEHTITRLLPIAKCGIDRHTNGIEAH